LVEEGVIDLNSNVNEYLTGWKIPENKFTRNEKVTLRRLLTHTAGMTVHGFPGYQQNDSFPTLMRVLNGEGNTPEITADTIPGSIWRYSGGGYTVMQKVVEDLSGLPLDRYMKQQILGPLGMEHSTYEQPLPSMYQKNASAAFDFRGNMIPGQWHNYPEQAAAGLWTTPTDLAKYCIAIQEILRGKSKGILSREMIQKMLKKDKNEWGLGPSLKWEADSLIFQHGGKNAGFTNSLIAFAHRGNAAIIMTNADNGGKLIGELLRSISTYYHWGIADYQVVESIPVSTVQLDKLVGHYKLEEQVPGIGDYIVEINRDHDQLIVIDSNNGERDIVVPLAVSDFIDLEDGDKMNFQLNKDTIGFIWNNTYQFYKID
jgi:CubicO group peptidase (beta-lactamase class C family)